MKSSIACVLAVLLLLPTALGKKEKKVDPRLKRVHTVFVKGGDGPQAKEARESIERGKCFRLAQDAETADAEMTVDLIPETQSAAHPMGSYGGVGGASVGEIGTAYRTAVTVKLREGGKLKKVWSDSLVQYNSRESRQTAVVSLIEKLTHDACEAP